MTTYAEAFDNWLDLLQDEEADEFLEARRREQEAAQQEKAQRLRGSK